MRSSESAENKAGARIWKAANASLRDLDFVGHSVEVTEKVSGAN